MANEIKVEFQGNLGAIAEVKTSAAGKQYLTMNVGSTPSKKVGNDWVNGETVWIRVTSFDMNVTLTDQLMKGAKVAVTGRLSIRTADNGRVYHDVVADEITVIPRTAQAPAKSDNPWPTKPTNSGDWGAPAYTLDADLDSPF